jgi:hypothetical protein
MPRVRRPLSAFACHDGALGAGAIRIVTEKAQLAVDAPIRYHYVKVTVPVEVIDNTRKTSRYPAFWTMRRI